MSFGSDRTVPLGKPGRGKEASDRSPRGRTCIEEGCSTILSTYNAAELCWLHAPAERPRPPSFSRAAGPRSRV